MDQSAAMAQDPQETANWDNFHMFCQVSVVFQMKREEAFGEFFESFTLISLV